METNSNELYLGIVNTNLNRLSRPGFVKKDFLSSSLYPAIIQIKVPAFSDNN